jgi:mono/diheme cytochrome c family protein
MKRVTVRSSMLITLVLAFFCCKSKNSIDDSGNIERSDVALDSMLSSIYSMSYSERSGKSLFDKYCVVCHGQEGFGDGFNSFNLEPRPRNLADSIYISTLSDARLSEMIAEGGRGTGKSVLMPAYGFTLSAFEIEDLVNYIRYISHRQVDHP